MERADLGPSSDEDDENEYRETVGFTPGDNFSRRVSELQRDKRVPSMIRAETSDGVPKYDAYTRDSKLFPKLKTKSSNETLSIPQHYETPEGDDQRTFKKIYFHIATQSILFIILTASMIVSFIFGNMKCPSGSTIERDSDPSTNDNPNRCRQCIQIDTLQCIEYTTNMVWIITGYCFVGLLVINFMVVLYYLYQKYQCPSKEDLRCNATCKTVTILIISVLILGVAVGMILDGLYDCDDGEYIQNDDNAHYNPNKCDANTCIDAEDFSCNETRIDILMFIMGILVGSVGFISCIISLVYGCKQKGFVCKDKKVIDLRTKDDHDYDQDDDDDDDD